MLFRSIPQIGFDGRIKGQVRIPVTLGDDGRFRASGTMPLTFENFALSSTVMTANLCQFTWPDTAQQVTLEGRIEGKRFALQLSRTGAETTVHYVCTPPPPLPKIDGTAPIVLQAFSGFAIDVPAAAGAGTTLPPGIHVIVQARK